LFTENCSLEINHWKMESRMMSSFRCFLICLSLFALPNLSFAQTPLPARIEAEHFTAFFDTTPANLGNPNCSAGAVDTELTPDIDGHCNIGFTVAGEWVEYPVSTPITADYRLVLRAATAHSNRNLRVMVDGLVRGTVRVPNQGWTRYNDVVVPVTLTAGAHVVRIVFASSSINLNYLNFVRVNPPWVDSDGDRVEDPMDICPGTPAGSAVDAQGCSPEQRDDDGDGLPNLTDICPTIPGPPVAHGCPPGGDEDGDWIVNEFDLCPLTMGLAELRGCKPLFDDFDRDGVADSADRCTYSILGETLDPEGCTWQDRLDDDFDGIINARDLCPTEPSWNSSDQGCPPNQLEDYDHDGVINALDRCPDNFGVKNQNGCWSGEGDPWMFGWDADQDGVDNKEDHCPFTPAWLPRGPNGCAYEVGLEDADQDGLANTQDLCLNSPSGHVVNTDGCTGIQAQQRMDSDIDGINDALDMCPDTFVDPHSSHPYDSVTLSGCRIGEFDGDRDGLVDSLDQCPWEPGHRLFAGCRHPQATWNDADLDGTPDQHDLCPLSSLQQFPQFHFDGCQGDDRADFDSDGVINGRDLCPASPAGQLTDGQGCNDYDRLDIDQDGVMNGVDLCPKFSGLPSRNGCAENPYDADMDGVENRFDHCPYSLPYDAVNERGCGTSNHFTDRDGDGAADDRDQCANTPSSQAADFQSGCSREQQDALQDEDGDGVGDRLDFCMGTPPETPVDARGCDLPWPERDDLDGDRVMNDMDQCPNTPRATAITHDGCEIFSGVRVTQALHRAFPREFPHLEIFTEEVPVQWSPMNPQPQPLLFEFDEPGVIDGIDLWTDGNRLNVFIPPNMQARPLRIPLRMRVAPTGELSNWFELVIGDNSGGAVSASLIINDPQVLEMTGIDLRAAFSLLSTFSTHPDPAIELFRQLWDSQRSMSSIGLPFFCTGEINGFPIVCDQPGTEVSMFDDWSVGMEMDGYRLTAVVNRLDLHNNWQDCGEHRLVFAFQNGGPQRKFLNLEARLPNPMPGDIQGCRPVIEFWRDLANVSGSEQAQRLHQFFYGSPMFMERVIAPQNFIANRGQIRSTQFWGGEWLFKEHKLELFCDTTGGVSGAEPCRYWIKTVSVKENSFGPLFDPNTSMPGNPFETIAMDFQQWFPQNLEGLLSNNPVGLHNRVAERFNHGQSHASSPLQFENDYLAQFNGQHWSPFGMDIQMAIQGRQNADGSPLMVEHVLARATAMTCAGCHAPDSFLSNFRDQIGVLELPDGTQINQWPLSHDFVHINEAGELSPAMREVFLPGRGVMFEGMTEEMDLMH
jgi:hypothetical protein